MRVSCNKSPMRITSDRFCCNSCLLSQINTEKFSSISMYFQTYIEFNSAKNSCVILLANVRELLGLKAVSLVIRKGIIRRCDILNVKMILNRSNIVL